MKLAARPPNEIFTPSYATDGINVISGMNFSCDQGFKIADPPKKKVTPENTNPSAIIALDAQTGKKVN